MQTVNDARASNVNAIDLRHRQWVGSALLSGRFRRVLEIGSFDGYSTEAYWTALEAGAVDSVHLCDIRLRPELQSAIDHYSDRHPSKVHFHQCPSTQLLAVDNEWDFIFVDSDHSLKNSLNELPLLLNTTAAVVALHDVCSYGHYPNCDGVAHIQRAFQSAGWLGLTDNVFREGERTHRGLWIGAKTVELYATVLDAYQLHC